MAFTYAGTLATDLDKVRFYIGDVTSVTGVKPDGTNFTDAELNGTISVEGSWQRAVAGTLEALANMYSLIANISIGPRSEGLGAISQRYAEQAAGWRKAYGRATGSGTVASSPVTRIDGWSDDVAANEL